MDALAARELATDEARPDAPPAIPIMRILRVWGGGPPRPSRYCEMQANIQTEVVTLDQARALAREVNRCADDVDVADLHWSINSASSQYRLHIVIRKMSRTKDRRARLNHSRDVIDAVLGALDGLELHERMQLALVDDPGQEPRDPLVCRRCLEGIRDQVARQDAKLPRADPKPSLDELRTLCGRLAATYEGQSGRRFSYGVPVGGGFSTEGSSWVAKVVRLIDPDITDGNLSTVMRDLSSHLNLRKPLQK